VVNANYNHIFKRIEDLPIYCNVSYKKQLTCRHCEKKTTEYCVTCTLFFEFGSSGICCVCTKCKSMHYRTYGGSPPELEEGNIEDEK
jgi:hypothetical protein